MLGELVCLVAAVVAATVSFRLSGTLLALVCATAGTLRLLPEPWWATVRNRGRGFDAALFFCAAVAMILLTWSIPG
jgi:succinate dehydrogenase/fumarate reductase cytochrome b subunit